VPDVVPVQHRAGAGDPIADMLGKLGNPDAEAGGGGGKRLRGVAVDVAVFVFAGAEDLVGHFLRDAQAWVADVARESFGMAEAGGEVIEVMV